MAVLRFEKNQIYDIDDLAHTISTQQKLPVFIEKTYSSPVQTTFAQFIIDPDLRDVLRIMIKSLESSEEVDLPDITDEPLHFNQRYNGSIVNYVLYGLKDEHKKNIITVYTRQAKRLARK